MQIHFFFKVRETSWLYLLQKNKLSECLAWNAAALVEVGAVFQGCPIIMHLVT